MKRLPTPTPTQPRGKPTLARKNAVIREFSERAKCLQAATGAGISWLATLSLDELASGWNSLEASPRGNLRQRPSADPKRVKPARKAA